MCNKSGIRRTLCLIILNNVFIKHIKKGIFNFTKLPKIQDIRIVVYIAGLWYNIPHYLKSLFMLYIKT